MAVLAGGISAANAADGQFIYRFSVDGETKVPEWVTINNIYGNWSNVGAANACSTWSPDTNTVNWGESFQQSRACNQSQVRDVTPVMLNPVLGTTKSGETYPQNGSVTVTQFQPAVGTLDYISGERADNWSAWVDSGSHYGCDSWTPTPDTINLYSSFEQTRECSQNQTRTRQVYNVWASGAETPKRIDSDSQTITETEKRQSTGSKDFIDGQRVGSWTAWDDEGGHYGCGTWSPATDTVNLNQSFTQNRDCSQDQTGSRNIYDVWKSGKETLNTTEPREQTITETESRNAVGTKDFIAGQRADAWPAWENEGALRNCTAWSPATTTVNLDESFTQSRSCKQDQTRERNVYDVWESEKETLNRTEEQQRVIDVPQTQQATGEKDFIVSTSTKEWGAWSNASSIYSCTAWSPETSTVKYGEDFTQERACKQNRTRSRDIYNVWASGKETLKETEVGNQTFQVDQTRGAVGTKDYVSGEQALAWSGWTNDGAPENCTAWTPAPSTVNLDASFTQTRSCDQAQTRERDVMNTFASGKKTHKRTETDSKVITVTQSQSSTGTKDYIVSTRNGDWSAWENDGGIDNCGAWSPAPTSQTAGFTQSRSCTQAQSRGRTVYNVWKSGKETVKAQEDGAQSVSVTDTRSVTVAWSSWTNSGTKTACSAWSPDASTVNLAESFTQTRSCSQAQTRNRTYKADGSTLATKVESRTISVTDTQTVAGSKDYIASTRTGSWSAWANEGGLRACSNWSPAPASQTSGFTQSRSCSQDQTRERTIYNVWKSGKETVKTTESADQTVAVPQSRTVSVTWTGWTNSGAVSNCTAWTPAPSTVNLGASFSQSRSCTQGQTRSRIYKAGSATLASKSESRNITVTQNQNATGSKDYVTGTSAGSWSAWSNKNGIHSCSSWTPDSSTVNLGQSYTQTRNCKQDQTRTRTIYNVWKSGNKTVKNTETGEQTVTVQQSRTSTGTEDYITTTENGAWSGWSNSGGLYSCGGWSPAPSGQTSNYTQTRSCKQNQTRTRTVYNVWKSGEKTVKTTEQGSQAVSKSQSRTIAVSWSGWANSGGAYECGSWSPSPSTVNLGSSFTQSRSCSQNQTRNRIYKAGSSTIATKGETRKITVTQTQSATGSKDYITGTSTKSWSGWSNDGGIHSCSGWSPAPSSQTSNYTQSRSCSQNQKRTREIYNVWKSGKQTLKTTETGTQTVSVPQSRTVTVSWSGWSNSGGAYSCGAWSPSPSTVNQGSTFTQSRSCSQNQTRSRIYKVGTSTIATKGESRTISVTQSQSATGTKDYVTGTSAGSWSSWSNDGGVYSCSGWSPAPSSQTSNYTQSRTCKQNQKRTRTIYNVWSSGKKTTKSTETGTQAVNVGQSRTVAVSWTGWSNSGGVHTCGGWSPAESTVNLGQSFTQSRSCKQNQTRSRVYKVGSSTISTKGESRTINTTQNQTKTGTKDYITGTTAKSWQGWVTTSGLWGCGGWSPAPSSQTSNFTQSRACKRTQENKREIYNVWKSGKQTFKQEEKTSRAIDVTDSRTVSVSWSGWSNSGGAYSCGTWSPSPSTVNQGSTFTQSRSCKQNQTRSRIYKVGSSTISTKGESRTINVTQSQSATGTKDYVTGTSAGSWSSWSNDGGVYSCSGWSPAPSSQTSNYTQSRTCKQNQKRTRTIYNVWSSGKKTTKSTETGTQAVNVGQSRTVAVSWTGWSNSGGVHTCGGWSPAESTVNLGQSFTQSRSCKQNQTRSRVYKVGSSTISTKGESRTINTTQNQTKTGTKDYITGTTAKSWQGWVTTSGLWGCGGWSPAPSSQTSNFTQSRACKRTQENKREIYNVWKSGKQTFKQEEKTSRAIDVTDSRTVSVSWSGWSNSGGVHTCSGWSPSPTTVNLGQSFTQTRSCKQNQTRTRYYKVGSSTLATKGESRTINTSQSQGATGSKDYITGTSYGGWSGWSATTSTSCNGWSPSTGSVDYGKSYTQSRSCSRGEKRTRTLYNVWKSGKKTSKSTQTDTRTNTWTENRSATGTKNIVTGSKTTYGSWQYVSTTCDSFSPSTNTVKWGQSFTQTRYCYKRYKRTRTENNVWADGSVTAKSSTTEYKNNPKYADTRTVTGTKNYVVNGNWQVFSHYTYTSWSCGSYSPSTSTVTRGQTFTQTRSCTRTRKKYVDVYNKMANGELWSKQPNKYHSSITQSKTESRSATGTRGPVPGDDCRGADYDPRNGTWVYCR
mgnify:CR=1 FL=1